MNWYWWFPWSLAVIDIEEIEGEDLDEDFDDPWYQRNLNILQEGLHFLVDTHYKWIDVQYYECDGIDLIATTMRIGNGLPCAWCRSEERLSLIHI